MDGYQGIDRGSPGCSFVVSGSGRGRVRLRERETLIRSFGNAITSCLLLCGLHGEGAERVKERIPVLLVQIVNDVVHELCRLRAPGVRAELLTGQNKIPSGVQFVCTFDLNRGDVRVLALEKEGYDILRRPQGRGHPLVGFQLLGLQLEGTP